MATEQQPQPRAWTRWFPNTLLDLPPLEPVFALRTPHRISFQAMPSSRDVLRTLLRGPSFDVTIDLDHDAAPLQHAPIHEAPEARMRPERLLEWPQYYWIVDGLQDDLAEAEDPATGLERGRRRLASVEELFSELPRGGSCDVPDLERAWQAQRDHEPAEYPRDATQTLQQYVRGLTEHLILRASSAAFRDWSADLLREADKSGILVPPRRPEEDRLLKLWLQHRLFGSALFTAPTGVVAGWHLLLSCYVLAVWFAGLLIRSGYETELEEALFGSLWMIDQGFLRDDSAVHDLLRNLVASEYTSTELTLALTTAMRTPRARL